MAMIFQFLARRGGARRGGAWRGAAGRGAAWPSWAWQGKHTASFGVQQFAMARRGGAGHGAAGLGAAWLGKANTRRFTERRSLPMQENQKLNKPNAP